MGIYILSRASQVAQWSRICLPVEEMQGTQIQYPGQKNPWRRKWQLTPVFLPRKFHGQRSLARYTVHGIAKSWTWLSTCMIYTIFIMGYNIYCPLRCIFSPISVFAFFFNQTATIFITIICHLFNIQFFLYFYTSGWLNLWKT